MKNVIWTTHDNSVTVVVLYTEDSIIVLCWAFRVERWSGFTDVRTVGACSGKDENEEEKTVFVLMGFVLSSTSFRTMIGEGRVVVAGNGDLLSQGRETDKQIRQQL